MALAATRLPGRANPAACAWFDRAAATLLAVHSHAPFARAASVAWPASRITLSGWLCLPVTGDPQDCALRKRRALSLSGKSGRQAMTVALATQALRACSSITAGGHRIPARPCGHRRRMGRSSRPSRRVDAVDIDLAVAAARAALETGAWGRLNATERGRLLSKVSRLVDALSRNWHSSRGRRHRQAPEAGARRCDGREPLFRILRRCGRQGAWRHDPVSRGYLVNTLYEPLGVTAHIIRGTIPARCSGAPWQPRSPWAMPLS